MFLWFILSIFVTLHGIIKNLLKLFFICILWTYRVQKRCYVSSFQSCTWFYLVIIYFEEIIFFWTLDKDRLTAPLVYIFWNNVNTFFYIVLLKWKEKSSPLTFIWCGEIHLHLWFIFDMQRWIFSHCIWLIWRDKCPILKIGRFKDLF